jgi:DNA polymerase III delta subunit
MQPAAAQGPQLLKQLTATRPLPPLVTIVCKDELRRRRAADHLVGPRGVDSKREFHRIRGIELSAQAMSNLLFEVSSLALFARERVWLVEDADGIKAAELRKLVDRLDHFPAGCTFIAAAGTLPAAHPLFKEAKKRAVLVELEELKGAALTRWIAREFEQQGRKNVSPDTIELLRLVTGSDIAELAHDIELLSLFAGGDEVSVDHVRSLFSHRPETSDFELIGHILQRDLTRSELLLNRLLQGGKNPFLLLGLLLRSWSQLLEIRSLLDHGASAADVRARLQLSPWIANKLLEQAHLMTQAKGCSAMEHLLKADTRLKGRSVGSDAVMGDLVGALCRL